MFGCWEPGERSSTSSGHLGKTRAAVIYGTDDRKEAIEHPDPKLREMSSAVGALLPLPRIQINGTTGEVTLLSTTLSERVKADPEYGKPLCVGEPFREDPAPVDCSVFLLGPRVVATAGHCISEASNLSVAAAATWCQQQAVVFGFAKDRAGKIPSLSSGQVYGCRRVLLHKVSITAPVLDIAVFELEREVKDIQPLQVDARVVLQTNDPLAVMGYPNGVPLKIATGGVVSEPRTTDGDFFVTNLDTLPGNSGSPIVLMSSYSVVGIHVRGSRPNYVLDEKNGCMKSQMLPQNPGKQAATYTKHIQLRACRADQDCGAESRCEENYCFAHLPDLVVTQVQLQTTPVLLGLPVSVAVDIKNIGKTDVTTPFRLGLWWSPNQGICPECGQDRELMSVDVTAGLRVSQTSTHTLRFVAQSPVVAGRQYLGAYVDDHNGISSQSTGKIRELDDANNAKSVIFDVQTCGGSGCSDESKQRCAEQRVEVCKKNTQGCLVWQEEKVCPSTLVCQDGACVKSCSDLCPQGNESRCEQQQVQICRIQTSGCLGWETTQTCSNQQLCKNGQCAEIDKPKPANLPDGTTCLQDAECLSGRCVVVSSSKICARPCSGHADCAKVAGLPFCRDSVCQTIPLGSCLTSQQCAATEVCSQERCQAEPKTPTGCGCSVVRGRFRDGFASWWLILVWLIFFYDTRRRSA